MWHKAIIKIEIYIRILWKAVEKFLSFLYINSISNHYSPPPHASHSPPFEKNFNVVDMTGFFVSYANGRILEWSSSRCFLVQESMVSHCDNSKT